MADVIFNRYCGSVPEVKVSNGWAIINCPICGRKMKMFPANMTESTNIPNKRCVPREIAEDTAKRWNESFLVKEVANG